MPTPLSNPRDVLTPDALAMVQRIAASGSFAAAARALGNARQLASALVRAHELGIVHRGLFGTSLPADNPVSRGRWKRAGTPTQKSPASSLS